MGTDKPRAAYVEDYDEEDMLVRDTQHTATMAKPKKSSDGKRASSQKKSRSDTGYPSQALRPGENNKPLTVEVVDEKVSKASKSERRKSTTSAPSPRKSSSRPPPTHRTKTFPLPQLDTNLPTRMKNDPSYYGVSQDGTPVYTQTSSASTSRPPSTYFTRRPQSLYGVMPVSYDHRPPPSRSAFWQIPPQIGGGSYPPQPPYSMQYYPPSSRERLESRFQRQDPITRTSSATGVRPRTQDFLDRYEEDSLRRSKKAEDAAAMPPPPSTIRRQSVAIEPRARAGSFQFDYEEDEDVPPRPSRPVYRTAPSSTRRSSSSRTRSSSDYLTEEMKIPVVTIPERQRSTYADQSARKSTYEEKFMDAAGYIQGVGGPTTDLTAEALKRQAQRGGTSSRSTQSTDSFGESDFKRSATTRTTRSSIDQEADDMTIRFKGRAKVNIGGAEITCDDGAEVNFVRRPSIRNGSERSGSDYRPSIDDRRSRTSRNSSYSRSTSQSVRPSTINGWL